MKRQGTSDKHEQCTLIYADHCGEAERRTVARVYFVLADSSDSEDFTDMTIVSDAPVLVQTNDITVPLTPKVARSIAYSLLWYANELEDGARLKRYGGPQLNDNATRL